MKLVLMGDLHFHGLDEGVPGWLEASDAFYRTLLGRFLEVDADVHIALGDLTNYGTATELRNVYKLLENKERTFYQVLGNHDLYAQTRNEVLQITGQARYHSIETERAVLAFLDTAKEMDYADWGGHVDEEQLQWLEGVVRASGTKPLLVFAHHPVFNTTKGSDAEKGSIHPDIDMWQVLGQKQGTGIYFNGHTHVDSIVRQKNWTFVQLSACLDQQAFRIVEVGQEEIRISALDVADEILTKHAPVLHKHMNHFTPNPDARGKELEREGTISLRTAVNQEV
ncbi:metallophosphoesterase family protein [Paenibacillus caui]|uniref:metallophosphoesterase family protein n=1 Tax=Paenibacillus caui TaxID=2873927 RepID=UPI001CA98452|nr:metallophosphoesterase [Paenibacillus caui]